MTDQANTAAGADIPLPNVRIPKARNSIDITTWFGIILTFGLIATAITVGDSDASFINIPSVLIVVLGTMTASITAYSLEEVIGAWAILKKTALTTKRDFSAIATELMKLAVVAKKKGILGLSAFDAEIKKDPFISSTVQMAIDGYKPEQIEVIVTQKIASQLERHKRTASITKRMSEVAPAMGLIGTLIGLVQMLAELENPESIGPAMALALLTTFYGAIMGTIVMSPLSSKLEKSSMDEAMFQNMVMETAISIAKQENPRSLEMKLNSTLPPSKRIVYFD